MKKLLTRRNAIRLGLAGFAGAGGSLAYTGLVEPFWVEFVKRSLPLEYLPIALVGKKLLQISDLHVARTSSQFLIESLQEAADLEPDFVVYTGDFVSLHPDTEEKMELVFPHLPKGKMGTAAILGNHDYGVNWVEEKWAEKIISALRRVDIPVLRNEILGLSGLQVAGLDELWANNFHPEKALPKLDPERPSLVLVHNPDALDRGGWGNYRGWILAGHTHGGQCKPPFLPPPLLPVRNKAYSAGYIPLQDGRQVYINRALGWMRQVRFNVRPEITVFTLGHAVES